MKPGQPKPDAARTGLLGRLRAAVERWISGSAAQNPLYLSNRTIGQKVLSWAKVVVPLVLVAAAAVYVLSNHRREDKLPNAPTAAEIAEKLLPDLNKPIHLETNTDIAVVEVRVDHAGGDKLAGTLRNTTDHEIQFGEVDFILIAENGSQVGAVNVKVNDLAAGRTVEFVKTIAEKTAVSAAVREVRTQ